MKPISRINRDKLPGAERTLEIIGILMIWIVLAYPSFAQTYKFISLPSPKDGYGVNPAGTLIRDAKGNIYGTNSNGAAAMGYYGTVIEITAAGKAIVLHTFHGSDGYGPLAGVFRDASGNLYGTTFNGGDVQFGVAYRIDTGGVETVLHSFQGPPDGANPRSALVRDSAGNLYGTTQYGGTGNNCGGGFSGCGTIFKIDASGNESVLYSFSGDPDGAYPDAGLLITSSGEMYGTTTTGGASNMGTVFRIDAAGNESVVYSFQGGTDGVAPISSLVQDATGNLYGVTETGGGAGCPNYGCGTVFKIDPSGTESVLYCFTGGGDGSLPLNGVVLDPAGNLYGMTSGGGDLHCSIFYGVGCGTLFKLTPAGAETTLHTFEGPDGAMPEAGLLIDSGHLYGTTFDGGKGYCQTRYGNFGCGVIFRLNP